MKKLLFQFDTDTHASVFDTVVAYDGGSDHVVPHANVHPGNVRVLVEGAIFTRAPKEKKNTAIFVGGSSITEGEVLFSQIQKFFFADFRVSVMLDSNGSNTTAAAAVARLLSSGSVKGKRAVILAGTGPVGTRAAYMLASEGADVAITSRSLDGAKRATAAIEQRFGIKVEAIEATDNAARAAAVSDAHLVLATGAAGVPLLSEEDWKNNASVKLMADANATPPLGIEGTEMGDRGKERHGKIVWGAIGFGTLKLELHRRCINQLFQANNQLLDAENIFELAKEMAKS